MRADEVGAIFDKAEAAFERATASSVLTNRALTKADRIFEQVDGFDGAARAARKRERARLNAGLTRWFSRTALALAALAIGTFAIGWDNPIGFFGFLGVMVAAAFIVAGSLWAGLRGRGKAARPSTIDVTPNLDNAAVADRFDSYLTRVRPLLPPSAKAEVDAMSATVVPLKKVLARLPQGDPGAQDARRLMERHIPGLIDHYLAVPTAFRDQRDSEDKTVDQRLVESLAAGRRALKEAAETLAKGDIIAFETQGRFMEARYGETDDN